MEEPKKKRGRPRTNRAIYVVPVQRLDQTIESEGVDHDTLVQESDMKCSTMLKVKRTGHSDDRLTMVQIHERRIEHIKSAGDLDEEDVKYFAKCAKYMQPGEHSNLGTRLNEYINDCFREDYTGNVEAVRELYERVRGKLVPVSIDDDEATCSCEQPLHVSDTTTASRICTLCGHVSIEQVPTTNDLWAKEGVQVLSKIAYKRINHFREWLNSIQAKQQGNQGLNRAIGLVQAEMKKQRITDASAITPHRIREYLHSLRLGKYYEYTSAIYSAVTNKPIPRFDAQAEIVLMRMFTAVQPVFDDMPKKHRKNFLSYSYTLHKLAQILGQTSILEFFPLLKSREKLYLQVFFFSSFRIFSGFFLYTGPSVEAHLREARVAIFSFDLKKKI